MIFDFFRNHRAKMADRNRTARLRAMVRRLTSDERAWTDASQAMELPRFLRYCELHLLGCQDATMLRYFADRISRRADFLDRVADAENAVRAGYSDNLRVVGGTDL